MDKVKHVIKKMQLRAVTLRASNVRKINVRNINFDKINGAIIFVVICELVGAFGSFFAAPAIPTWYYELTKPAYTPPNWLFEPIWIALYLLMGLAAYLVWDKRIHYRRSVRIALIFFLIQLVLNTVWSIIFFKMHSPWFAFVEMVLLWIAILITTVRFNKISPIAAYLLIPYIFWVTYVAIVNLAIAVYN